MGVNRSLPSQGAWIEINLVKACDDGDMSLPSQGAWIEINMLRYIDRFDKSLPSQGAWIEISLTQPNLLVEVRRSLHRGRGLKLSL